MFNAKSLLIHSGLDSRNSSACAAVCGGGTIFAVLLLLLRLTAPVSGACQDLAASDHYVTAGEQKMTSK